MGPARRRRACVCTVASHVPLPSRPHLTPPCGVSDRLCSASATPPLEVWSARQAHASSAARQRWAGQCSATLASPRLPSSVGRRPCPSAARALLRHPTESAGHFCPNHCGYLLSPASEYLTRHKTTRTCTSYEPSPSPTITDTGGCCYTVRTTDSKVPRHDSQNAETVKTVLACTSAQVQSMG